MPDLETFKQMVLFCKEHAVTQAKLGDMEIILEPEGSFLEAEPELSEDDLALVSAY